MSIKGSYYLCLKEVKRFLSVWQQTLLSPLIISLMYLFIFAVVVNMSSRFPSGVSFLTFLVPGLVMMQVLQATFVGVSTTVVMSKMFGTMGDYLSAPLTPSGISMAFTMAAVVRGIVITVIVFLGCEIFTALMHNPLVKVAHPFLALYFVVIASFIMGSAGLVCGLWARTFDRLSGISTMVVTPLTFLSGTFYSSELLPKVYQKWIFLNPVFVMIDGFRYCFTGKHTLSLGYEITALLVLGLVLQVWCTRLIKVGYRIKS